MPNICPSCHGIPAKSGGGADHQAKVWLHRLVQLAESVVDAAAEAGVPLVRPTICVCNGLRLLLSNEAYVEARPEEGQFALVMPGVQGPTPVIATDKQALMREVVLQYIFTA